MHDLCSRSLLSSYISIKLVCILLYLVNADTNSVSQSAIITGTINNPPVGALFLGGVLLSLTLFTEKVTIIIIKIITFICVKLLKTEALI